MLRYVLQRLVQLPLPLLAVTIAVFIILHISGDPVDLLLGMEATQEQRTALREKLGLDAPLPVQYGRFLFNAVRGDFGRSLRFKQSAMSIVLDRLPDTLLLASTALILATIIGIVVGTVAAQRRGSPLDLALTSGSILGQSMPSFWIGIMLIILFSVRLRILPSSGTGSWKHLVLPTTTLALFILPQIMLLTRSAMLDVMQDNYITVARAKGLNSRAVVYGHALKNAIHPVVTYIGLQLGILLGGAIITESVFSWPGVGLLLVQSIYNRDIPVVEAAVVLMAIGIVLSNLLADVTNAILDPRIRMT